MLGFFLLRRGVRFDAPGRTPRPRPQRIFRPLRRLVLVTLRARIWNCVLLRVRRIDESESMRPYHRRSKRRFNLRHMARDTFAPRRSFFVMGMLGQSRFVRPVRRFRAMAFEAEHSRRFA